MDRFTWALKANQIAYRTLWSRLLPFGKTVAQSPGAATDFSGVTAPSSGTSLSFLHDEGMPYQGEYDDIIPSISSSVIPLTSALQEANKIAADALVPLGSFSDTVFTESNAEKSRLHRNAKEQIKQTAQQAASIIEADTQSLRSVPGADPRPPRSVLEADPRFSHSMQRKHTDDTGNTVQKPTSTSLAPDVRQSNPSNSSTTYPEIQVVRSGGSTHTESSRNLFPHTVPTPSDLSSVNFSGMALEDLSLALQLDNLRYDNSWRE